MNDSRSSVPCLLCLRDLVQYSQVKLFPIDECKGEVWLCTGAPSTSCTGIVSCSPWLKWTGGSRAWWGQSKISM